MVKALAAVVKVVKEARAMTEAYGERKCTARKMESVVIAGEAVVMAGEAVVMAGEAVAVAAAEVEVEVVV